MRTQCSGCAFLAQNLHSLLAALRRLRPLVLNPAGQLLMTQHLDDRVLLGDFRVGVAGKLRGLDATAADLPAISDVGAAH